MCMSCGREIGEFIKHPWMGIVIAILLTVAAWKMNSHIANLLLVTAEVIFVYSVFYISAIRNKLMEPRILWTVLLGSVFGVVLYCGLWTPSVIPPKIVPQSPPLSAYQPTSTTPKNEPSAKPIAETNTALFHAYIVTNDVETSNTVSDSKELAQDGRTIVFLPKSRQITLKLKTDEQTTIPSYCINFFSNLSTNGILPKNEGWLPAAPEAALSQIDEQFFYNTNTSHLTWTSSEPYTRNKIQERSLAIATNVQNSTVDAEVEVFSDAPLSKPQKFLVRFILAPDGR